jgi:hypothetical protein
MFDHVADGDDAGKPALIHDRDVTEFSKRHALHDAGNGLALVTGRDFARHRRAYGLIQCPASPFGQRAYNIAFRQDPGDTTICADNNHCTDTLFGEQFDRGSQTGVWFDDNDIAALAREDDTDSHSSLPCLHHVGPRRPTG